MGRTASRWLAKLSPAHVRCQDEPHKVLQCRLAINEAEGVAGTLTFIAWLMRK
jgi:hypothetical protein